jgi:hypothetical protein
MDEPQIRSDDGGAYEGFMGTSGPVSSKVG